MQTDVFEKFREFLLIQRGLKENSADKYIREIKRLYDEYEGDILSITNYSGVSDLIIKVKRKHDHSDRTTYKLISQLKVFYDFCMKFEFAYQDKPHPLYLGHSFKKGRSPEPQFFDRQTDDEVLAQVLWHTGVTLRDRCILWVFFSTAIRRGELVALNLSDLDLSERFVHVRSNTSKTEKGRFVPFDKECADWLTLYLKSLRLQWRGRVHSAFPLFPTDEGERLKPSSIGRIVSKITQIIQVGTKINPHKFRHSLASHLIKKGMHITQVAELLGHSSISTTADIYTHWKRESIRSTYDDLTENTENKGVLAALK